MRTYCTGDHMQWSKEEEETARKKVKENSAVRVLLEEQVKYENDASKYWDTFYKIHKNKFFKDRNWLLREFPEILPVDQETKEKVGESSWDHLETKTAYCSSRMHCSTMPEEKYHCKKSSGPSDGKSNLDSEHRKGALKTELFPGSNATFRILEVGCGAGNSVFPILNTLRNIPESFLYCCDFASGAVELVKSHSSYRAAQCSAFVHDICDGGLPYPFPDGTLDVILLVFVLSAIHPDRMQGVVNRLSKLLKPGGMLLFRDYGRYDKTQLRFKKGHCLSENFYVRGDGTRAYFFTKGWGQGSLIDGVTKMYGIENVLQRKIKTLLSKIAGKDDAQSQPTHHKVVEAIGIVDPKREISCEKISCEQE
ncbi:tRNA N(3)-methylcytidine methyltransferase METTL8, mitochondrial isoform X5 [Nycticebus coucang]|uniref:tRNA N(3)-methylcytidine methyltransferase METTL8, mitochondrial isoform X5 n=1 Tax=Nycticebus coucang TaxID=9470 RepID=UPI00234C8507|nr:tRNA N(3)-methylcytidine methyltransferase METTL8, mitochondrial isoform X5 [Nycticebus coucang]